MDPLEIMMRLANKASEIARARGVQSNELDKWSICLDDAWKQIKHGPYQTRQELAAACNNPELNKKKRR